jgi:hypothetical protein
MSNFAGCHPAYRDLAKLLVSGLPGAGLYTASLISILESRDAN